MYDFHLNLIFEKYDYYIFHEIYDHLKAQTRKILPLTKRIQINSGLRYEIWKRIDCLISTVGHISYQKNIGNKFCCYFKCLTQFLNEKQEIPSNTQAKN